MCLVLKKAGYNVYQARDGRDALEALQKRRYDVVLTDYHMPRMNGLELLDRVRGLWPDTPVIIASSDSRVIDQSQGSARPPAYALMAKPFDTARLLGLVRSAACGPSKTIGRPEPVPGYRAVA